MKNNLIYAEIVQVLQYVLPVYNFPAITFPLPLNARWQAS
jgi:hypothetical protein